MKKTLYFIFTFCALILTSCSGYPFRDTTAYHYVAAYYPVDSFYVVEYRNSFDYVTKETSIYLGMIGDFDGGVDYMHQKEVYSDYYENSGYTPTQEQYDKYVELCEKHHDYGYKHKVEILSSRKIHGQNGPGYVKGYTYWDITPVSIDVVSNADFDENHFAGTSLNDIILFTTFSPYSFIKNGYKGKEFVKNKKTLDRYTQDDFKLIFCVAEAPIYSDLDKDNYGCLTFTTEPTKNKEHTLTITIKDDYGRIFTDSLTVVFK